MGAFKHISRCSSCELRKTANRVVVGSGPESSRFMLVGEAPGADEDESGIPFVGRSGALLVSAMESVGITRDEFYITNVVKCRPPGNSDPTSAVVAACSPNLRFQIAVIQPAVIVTVGRFALKWFIKNLTISEAHGKIFEWRGTTIYPLLHPAYILRNRRLYADFVNDMAELRRLMDTSVMVSTSDMPLFSTAGKK